MNAFEAARSGSQRTEAHHGAVVERVEEDLN